MELNLYAVDAASAMLAVKDADVVVAADWSTSTRPIAVTALGFAAVSARASLADGFSCSPLTRSAAYLPIAFRSPNGTSVAQSGISIPGDDGRRIEHVQPVSIRWKHLPTS